MFRYLTGVRDHKLQKELLQVTDPSVEKLDSVVEKYEVSQLCMKGLHISQAKSNTAVGQGGSRTQPTSSSSSKGKATTQPGSQVHKNAQTNPNQSNQGQFKCFHCRSKNRDHSCAAKNAVCKFCKKKGHFQSCLLYTSDAADE